PFPNFGYCGHWCYKHRGAGVPLDHFKCCQSLEECEGLPIPGKSEIF
uniref:Uncharacterized protein n=1 Tax=Mustela putorius furo TaxID=9669 RepID=M3XSP5_MUSPF